MTTRQPRRVPPASISSLVKDLRQFFDDLPVRWAAAWRGRRLARMLRLSRRHFQAWPRLRARMGAAAGAPDALIRRRYRRLVWLNAQRAAREAVLADVGGAAAGFAFLLVAAALAVTSAANLHTGITLFVGVYAMLVAYLPVLRLADLTRHTSTAVVIIAAPCLIVDGAAVIVFRGTATEPGWQWARISGYGHALLAGAAASATMLTLVFLAALLIALPLTALLHRPTDLTDPDAPLLVELIELFLGVTDNDTMASPHHRRKLISRLGRVAALVQTRLGQALDSGTAPHRRAVTERLASIAETFRSHQVLLAVPDHATQQQVEKLLTTAIHAVCTGRLGAIPGTPVPAPSSPRWRTRLTGTLRFLVVSLLPIAVVGALTRAGMLTGDTFGHVVTGAALVWILVCALTALDPDFSTKLGFVRDTITFLRTQSRDGDRP